MNNFKYSVEKLLKKTHLIKRNARQLGKTLKFKN